MRKHAVLPESVREVCKGCRRVPVRNECCMRCTKTDSTKSSTQPLGYCCAPWQIVEDVSKVQLRDDGQPMESALFEKLSHPGVCRVPDSPCNCACSCPHLYLQASLSDLLMLTHWDVQALLTLVLELVRGEVALAVPPAACRLGALAEPDG